MWKSSSYYGNRWKYEIIIVIFFRKKIWKNFNFFYIKKIVCNLIQHQEALKMNKSKELQTTFCDLYLFSKQFIYLILNYILVLICKYLSIYIILILNVLLRLCFNLIKFINSNSVFNNKYFSIIILYKYKLKKKI